MSQYTSSWVPTLKASFLTSYEGAVGGSWALQVANVIESSTAQTKLIDLSSAGTVTEWKGKRQVVTPKPYNLTITHKKYQSAFTIDEADVNRDSIGIYEAHTADLAGKAADHANTLVAALISDNGTSTFDGQNFFDTDHSEGDSGTQVNAITSTQVGALAVAGAGTTATPDEMSAAILGSIAYMYTFKDSAGDLINGNAKEFLFVTANPNLWGSAVTATSAANLTAGASNPLVAGLMARGYKVTPILDGRVGSSTDAVFYLFRTDTAIKPFVIVDETGIIFDTTDESSDMYKVDGKYLWAYHYYRGAGYQRWQGSLKCTLS